MDHKSVIEPLFGNARISAETEKRVLEGTYAALVMTPETIKPEKNLEEREKVVSGGEQEPCWTRERTGR